MDDKRKVIGFVNATGKFSCVEHAETGGGELYAVTTWPNPIDAPVCDGCEEGKPPPGEVPRDP